MKIVRSGLKTAALVIACASVAACADAPSRQADLDYRSRAPAATQGANHNPDGSEQRLTIQSGSGAKLNLPWFIRDTQDMINSN